MYIDDEFKIVVQKLIISRLSFIHYTFRFRKKEEMVYTSDTSCSSDSTSAQSNHTSSTTMEQNEDDLGAASHAYEAIKDAWTWGRHETPFSPVLGWTEGLTSATVGLFGTDLKGIDDGLKPQVADLDEHFVKPTISNVKKILSDLKREDEKAC